jgi:hypothetical protein
MGVLNYVFPNVKSVKLNDHSSSTSPFYQEWQTVAQPGPAQVTDTRTGVNQSTGTLNTD